MSIKYKTTLQCEICGEELSTGWCKTRLEKWFKKRKLKKEHFHTRAEVMFYHHSGVYMPFKDLDGTSYTHFKSPTYPRPPVPGSEDIKEEER